MIRGGSFVLTPPRAAAPPAAPFMLLFVWAPEAAETGGFIGSPCIALPNMLATPGRPTKEEKPFMLGPKLLLSSGECSWSEPDPAPPGPPTPRSLFA